MKDDELQSLIESGRDLSSTDAKAYRAVFNALNKETEFSVNLGVEDRIMKKVLAQTGKKEAKADVRWLSFGVVTTSICMLASLLSLPKFAGQMTTALSGPAGLVAFAMLMIGALHLVDRWLRGKQNRMV